MRNSDETIELCRTLADLATGLLELDLKGETISGRKLQTYIKAIEQAEEIIIDVYAAENEECTECKLI